jgi:hypothetical protein
MPSTGLAAFLQPHADASTLDDIHSQPHRR